MDNLKLATSFDEFDTDAYYKKYRAPLDKQGTVQSYNKFFINTLHDVFSTGSISGDRLLDVGTGGSLISFLSASRYVKEIHLSDLLPSHLDLLQRWVEGEERENTIVQYVIDKENDGLTCEERLANLRKQVTQIKFIDVTKDPPLLEPEDQYDVITSTFCLEVATRSVPEFKEAVRNVGTLVKPAGYLVLVGTLQEQFYVVGNVKFWNACITKTDVISALTEVSFTIVFWKTLANNKQQCDINEMVDFESFFVIVAQKISNSVNL